MGRTQVRQITHAGDLPMTAAADSVDVGADDTVIQSRQRPASDNPRSGAACQMRIPATTSIPERAHAPRLRDDPQAMRGRHHNIFYYFRGPSKTAGSAQAQEESQHRQVEDNTTKALINLLEHGEPGLTTSFLERFVPAASLDGLEQRAYHLQGGPVRAAEPTWLLGLSVLGELDPKVGPAPTTAGSRVDAVIHLPGSALALIEVKVVEYLDPHQLVRHAKEWKLPLPPLDQAAWPDDAPWRLARWADVYEWASTVDVASIGPVSRFLLEQFCEYLQLVGLAPFAGFRDEHFA